MGQGDGAGSIAPVLGIPLPGDADLETLALELRLAPRHGRGVRVQVGRLTGDGRFILCLTRISRAGQRL